MQFLRKLFFYGSAKSDNKRELFISSDAVDFITWFKKQDTVAEGTMVHTIFKSEKEGFIRHVVDGQPEFTNKMAFDSMFFKITVQYLPSDAEGWKKYTAWVNPDNVAMIYTLLPGTAEIHFNSGDKLIVSNSAMNVIKALSEHNKAYKERKRKEYAQRKAETRF